jgi:hypothetical protein
LRLDLSTIFIFVIAVVPGLFAQRTRNQLVPQSFAAQGASAELAELIALGVATHGVLAFLAAAILSFTGWLLRGNCRYFFLKIDSLIASQWCSQHIVETSLAASG